MSHSRTDSIYGTPTKIASGHSIVEDPGVVPLLLYA